MALGSVSISTFIPGELEDLTGTVSIIPYTRAEIERLANKKAYPDGQLVYTARATFSYKSSEILTLPATVDYVKLSGGTYASWVQDSYHVPEGTKLTRGSSFRTNTSSYYAKITFSEDGTLRFDEYDASNKVYTASLNVEGYHYY